MLVNLNELDIMLDEMMAKRVRLGLSQKDFALALGIPLNTVKSWDCRRRYPSIWAIKLINFYLDSLLDTRNAGKGVS